MKKYRNILVICAVLVLFALLYFQDEPPMDVGEASIGSPYIIWADTGAGDKWDDAYPVGNGRLGAMAYGNYPNEKILINEETIWAKAVKIPLPENSIVGLNRMVELEAKGDYLGVDQTFMKEVFVQSQRPDSYQLLGWLEIKYIDTAEIKDTRRSLDIKTGKAQSVHTLVDGTVITQTLFASSPDDVIVLTVSANKPISFELAMEGGTVIDADLVKAGSADGEEGTKYVSRVRAYPLNKRHINDGKLIVSDSRESVVYLSVATDFNRADSATKLADGWQEKPVEVLDRLAEKPIEVVTREAIDDHQQYFDRLVFEIGDTAQDILALTTEARLERIKAGEHDDPDLIETYVQFGRYLLISSSRPGTLPANLQGIWNPHSDAPWKSDYHLNINVQMNYWLAETANLSELHTPFFDLIRSFQPAGRDMARRMGMKGWVMGHATDVWGHARNMGLKAKHSGTFFGGQWMTFHILEHYRFNRDQGFLEANWDILTASTQFVDSWLIDAPEEGMLMARPAASPENPFFYRDVSGQRIEGALSAGTTFDQFMVLQVFSDYLEAAEALGKQDDPFVQQIKATIPRVMMPKIGADGRLQEWRLPFEETDAGHRHISHAVGAFPGNQINLDNDLVMRDAVVKSLNTRLESGGAGTGWSRAWTIGMFARLADKERAYENLHAILAQSTLSNLWDNHPPFQIDGNFGATAAVMEMLVHSHNNEIKLLPALPDAWKDGAIKGVRARGDYTLDVSWQAGTLAEVTITAGARVADQPIELVYGDSRKDIQLDASQSITLSVGDLR